LNNSCAQVIIFRRNTRVKEASMADGQFDKDFGYLMPFLDKVAAAANNIQEPAAREELRRLMSDEKTKWSRVRQLLSNLQGQADNPSAQSTSTTSGDTQAEAQTSKTTEAFTFTVGSLRPGKS
jgi:hypothetical protein